MSSLASSLPAELLRMIFELLDQPVVLAAAGVSRTWRTTAVHDHSYYRAWRFLFPPGAQPFRAQTPRHPHETDLTRFAQIVQDAERRQYALGLTICVQRNQLPFNAADEALEDGLDNADDLLELAEDNEDLDWQFIEDRVVPVLRRAVPRLARLDIQVEPGVLSALILAALTVPAPLLWDLSIYVFQVIEDYDPGELLPDVFAGSAPLLKEVNIIGLRVHTPQPCFANVTSLDLNTKFIPDQLAVAISAFPRIRHLGLYGLHDSLDDAVISDATGAFFQRLDSLYIGDYMECHTLTPFASAMAHIPDISIVSSRGTEALAQILGVPVPSELILCEWAHDDDGPTRRYQFSQLFLQLRSPTSVRAFDGFVSYDKVFHLLRSSAAARTLTKVTIDDRLVRSLMDACPSLPLLEELSIVLFIWETPGPGEIRQQTAEHSCACPPTAFASVDSRPPEGAPSIDCPRLSTLELYATRPDATVQTDVLLALSRTFSGPQLELVLANGLSLSDTDGPDAASAFRSIRCRSDKFILSRRAARAASLLREASRLGDRVHGLSCPHY